MTRCPVDGAELLPNDDVANVMYVTLALDGGTGESLRVRGGQGGTGGWQRRLAVGSTQPAPAACAGAGGTATHPSPNRHPAICTVRLPLQGGYTTPGASQPLLAAVDDRVGHTAAGGLAQGPAPRQQVSAGHACPVRRSCCAAAAAAVQLMWAACCSSARPSTACLCPAAPCHRYRAGRLRQGAAAAHILIFDRCASRLPCLHSSIACGGMRLGACGAAGSTPGRHAPPTPTHTPVPLHLPAAPSAWWRRRCRPPSRWPCVRCTSRGRARCCWAKAPSSRCAR